MTPRVAPFAVLLLIAVPTWLMPTSDSGATPPHDDYFTTSEQCAICHNGAPGAKAMRDQNDVDVSPYLTWQGTMMANSFRDPYFRAQLQKETAAAGEEVQELCLRCHTPMTHHEARLNDEPTPRLAQALDDMAADDGVSCTVCHMMKPDGLGEERTWSGRPNFNGKREIYGPFADVFPRPMQMHVDYTPKQGEHIRDAGMCATCHTLFTEHNGTPFPEQTPFLEWRNSEFDPDREGNDPKNARTCQQCHMAEVGNKTRIARNPMGFDFGRIPKRDLRSHAFVGGNAFMLDLLRVYEEDLDVVAEPEALEAAAKATREQLRTKTAKLTIGEPKRDGDTLAFALKVENQTGHKFPGGYPARRAWLHVQVSVGGDVVFESGACGDDGRIVGVEDALRIPHTNLIQDPSDVVVYELVATDPDGAPTTFLTKMVGKLKDSRLLPRGFTMDGPHIDDIAPVGVDGDTDFVGGGDTIACRVPLPSGKHGKVEVRARLLYQTVPPRWVDDLRGVEAEEAKRFVRYYDAADKTPELIDEARY